MKRLLTACLAVLALALMLPVDPAVSAYRIGDIACESSEDTGTGALDLDGAYREYQSFSEAGIADGDSFPYHLRVGSGETTKFETGIATFTDGTPDSITRDVDQSSDGAATALDVQDPSVICISLTSRHFTAHRYMIGEVIEIANPELPDGCLWPDGSNVSRSTYSALLDALSVQLEGDTTDTSDEIANTSKDVSVLGLVGKKIEGAGIPADTTITAATANTITLSANATATATDVPLRIFGYGNGDGATTFGIPDLRGRAAVTRDNIAGTSANRLTGVSGSLDGDVLGNAGGGETFTIAQANLPNVNFSHTLTLPNHAHDDTFTLPNHAHSETLTLPNHAHGHTLTLPDHIHSETLTLPAHSHPDTFTLPAHTHPESLTLPAHSHPDTLAAPAHTHTMAHTHTVSALITSGADTTQSGANHNFTSGTPTTSASSAANT